MGTEMRIGIAAGLVIVAATGVYFFYGSDRSEGDLLLTRDAPASDSSESAVKSKAKPAARVVAARDGKPAPATQNKRVAKMPPDRESTAKSSARRPSRSRPMAAPTVVLAKLPNTKTDTAPIVSNRGIPAAKRTGRNPAGTLTKGAPLVLTSTERSTPSSPSRFSRVSPARMPAKGKTIALGSKDRQDTEIPKVTAKPEPEPNSNGKPIDRKSSDDRNSEIKSITDRPVRVATRRSTPKRNVNRRTNPVTRPVVAADSREPSRPAIRNWPRHHTIASGDTLSHISMKYYGTSRLVGNLLRANPDLKGPRSLKIGRVLIVPAPDSAGNSSMVRLASHREPSSKAGVPVPRSSNKSSIVVAPSRRYTVQKGDTFYSISRKVYGSTGRWSDLFNANKSVVKNPSKLKPGMILNVPA